MDKGFASKSASKKSSAASAKPQPSKFKKTVNSWLKQIWRKKMLVLDIALFAAAAGAIYAYGDKICSLFTDQLPPEDAKMMPMSMPEPE